MKEEKEDLCYSKRVKEEEEEEGHQRRSESR